MHHPTAKALGVCALLAAALLASTAIAATPQGDSAVDLTLLRPGHPRLIALDSHIERIRELVKTDATAKAYLTTLRGAATRLLKKPPVEYKVVGPRLLHVSREALMRIMTLGLVYRIDGRDDLADRAIQELMTISRFKDWHPSHFLDTAEMTHAAAIGYDWLHARLTAAQRRTLRTAIVNKGLLAAKPFYDNNRWWVASRHNWNQVCNGGIAIGALAIADEEPKLAQAILTGARKSIVRAMNSYAPDGGWAEGPGYWHYATRYNVYYIAALETALGTDLGLKKIKGFAQAGDFRLHFVSPIHHTFNYADAGERAGRAAEMFWLATAFDRPLYAWHQRSAPGQCDPWDLIWFDPRGKGPAADKEPLDRHFTGVQVAFLRSAWEDPDAVFVGFKGGDNRANHSHLDLGVFVLDALGQRWAVDLGGDYYNLPGYFGRQRWTYYRLKTEGHNTLVINGQNQDTRAKAPIVAFDSTPTRAFAVADLTQANRTATRWHRGMALLNRRDV
ncbi:heparinase II/III family protein, partial [bacterium]|nr:heparinase II/III family protein [bacterium]